VINKGEKCKVLIKKEWIEAEYVGVFQRSDVIGESMMVGGHPGGTVAFPVIVAKVNNELKEFLFGKVKF
jgi:hypothetical protein